ncbi:hypothetical protein NP493_60g04008 [Ridgeia piscesae]|uniref:Uncharacterized protein n=1 Tax=Ridgeia piscesae TaxID=27915 RepID=A0AAD9PAP9_RIDPI|nr:hypothetical protein NP493_60g04008 [Ridgeia piscesae]
MSTRSCPTLCRSSISFPSATTSDVMAFRSSRWFFGSSPRAMLSMHWSTRSAISGSHSVSFALSELYCLFLEAVSVSLAMKSVHSARTVWG